ncbi:Bacteriophage lysis protein [Serratia fonticola]|uniref:lysis protein n=1 Tax=Serratia fonticola TaxID=47917 RepID=UPI002183712B|nr:lysis protein [Serratia fonticola]CAI2121268.1 Bacteriophage lysis protein [Serratia fonticola]
MTWSSFRWVACFMALGLLVYLISSNQSLRAERDNLQTVNGKLTGQLEWQNSMQRVVAAIDESRSKELIDAKIKIDDLERNVAAGRYQLRINAKCPTASASMADAGSPRLDDAAQRDYFTLRKRIEHTYSQIAGLQDYIRNVCLNR